MMRKEVLERSSVPIQDREVFGFSSLRRKNCAIGWTMPALMKYSDLYA